MLQHEQDLEVNGVDDWGDFDAVIHQLEAEEKTEQSFNHEEPEPQADNSEAVEGLLTVAFTVAEQATSIISDVEFEFPEKSKQSVIESAVPVIKKHGSTLMAMFGDYIEEATLLLAILGLIYSSKKQLKAIKGGDDEQKEAPTSST